MQFFTSPEDIRGWVKIQESPDQAANKILDMIGGSQEQDVVETCREIFDGQDNKSVENASKILFGVLAKHNISEIKTSSGDKNMKMIKEAQMMRQDSVYGGMPLRICPKLPMSVGKKLISTYNCRHYCLDSVVFDDDPERVYCGEALWRQHVMDKFSREWRNDEGQLVGGYVNERFQVYHENGGNPMQLAKHERTRHPRAHQWSTERRLSDARGDETFDVTIASSNSLVKIASTKEAGNTKVNEMFDDILEMKSSGMKDDDIIFNISEHYEIPVHNATRLHSMALQKVASHSGTLYTCSSSQLTITSQYHPTRGDMLTSTIDIDAVNVNTGNPINLTPQTKVVVSEINLGTNEITLEVVDGAAVGQKFKVKSLEGFTSDTGSEVQDTASEVGLNDGAPVATTDVSNPAEQIK